MYHYKVYNISLYIKNSFLKMTSISPMELPTRIAVLNLFKQYNN